MATETDSIYDEPVRLWQRIHPSFWAFINLIIFAYGIYVKNWDFFTLMYVMWMELHLIAAMMLIRVFFAREYRESYNITGEKMSFIAIGILMSTACITLVVAMTYDLPPGEMRFGQYGEVNWVIFGLLVNHLIRISLHYFQNDLFRKANPATQMIVTFVYQAAIVSILIGIVIYYMPRTGGPDGVKAVALEILSLKLLIDLLYSGIHLTIINWLTPPPRLEKKKG